MKNFNCNKIQYRILRAFYRLAPFNIKGALDESKKNCQPGFLSCLIISNKLSFLKDILEDLGLQTLAKEDFEVVVVFDGQQKGVSQLVSKYQRRLNIYLHQIDQPLRVLSDLRNISVALSQGQFILFLDDDTRIFQKDFLESGLAPLKEGRCDILIPRAHSLYGVVRARYDFLDKFSFTNRCSFWRRATIEEAGGFLRGLQTYEDTELSIRLMIKKPTVIQMEEIKYYHPPLYFDTMRKPLAIGQAIFQVRRHYSFLVWMLVYLNALRFLPYGLLPGQRYRHWFKISLGVLLYPFTGKSYYY
jgi:glycosyltransferase involved in cell wall biosynthesis